MAALISTETGEKRIPMSYEEYLALGEDVHAEWVNGEVIVFLPASDKHQAIVGFLHVLLDLFANLFNLGAVRLAPYPMRARPDAPAREPDILFVAREHLDRLTSQALAGAADLVIEVISDDSVARDRADKFYEYQEAGIPEYWILDPREGKQRVDVYALSGPSRYEAILADAEGRYHSRVLPGFWFRAEWLWQEPLFNPLKVISEIAPQAVRDALGGY